MRHQILFFILYCHSLFTADQPPFKEELPTEILVEQSQVIIPWKNKTIAQTEKFPLMGKQMGVVDTLGIKPLGYEIDNGVKVFRLVAQPVEKTITNGEPVDPKLKDAIYKITNHTHPSIKQKVRGWGYNGSIIGPTIEINQGDRVRIILKNELPEPTSIHWHGLEVPNSQDGAAPTTQEPLKPGETTTYEFTVFQSGTFMYHSGFNIAKQDLSGLGGFFIAHPKEQTNKPDKEFAIMLQEWSLTPGNIYPNLMTMSFNFFTFNGLAAPNIPVLHIKQGERVRLRIGNLSMNSHPIHIHGYTWNVVGTEGGPIKKSAQWKGATINVAPGETRDVEFVAWNPGTWRLHCHKLHHIMNMNDPVPLGIMPRGGMFTLVYVEPKDPDAPWTHPAQGSQ